MDEERVSPLLDHPSYAVDALLVLTIGIGLWLFIAWASAPPEQTSTFDMQLVPDTRAEAVYIYDAPAPQSPILR